MDNRILLIDYMPLTILGNGLLNESMLKTGKFFVECILQKADTENANGRIYPKLILEREAERYIKSVIIENRAFGELDHPECHDPATKILTETGWKYISEISDSEIVATINPDNMNLEYHQINRKIEKFYEGDMLQMKHASFDALVTPNHKFMVNTTTNKTTQTFVDAINLNTAHLIPKRSNWVGTDLEFFPLTYDFWNNKKQQYETVTEYIPTSIFMELLGWYITEGWVSTIGYNVNISQTKKETKKEIISLLEKLPYVWYRRTKNDKVGTDDHYDETFNVVSKALWVYLKKLGKSTDKYIPSEVKNLSIKYLQILLDTLIKGDGSGETEYYTISKQLADDVSEIMIKCGYSASITENIPDKVYYKVCNKETLEEEIIHNIYYYTKNKSDTFELVEKINIPGDKIFYNVRKKSSNYYHVADMDIETINYSGMVYCVDVPNHTFIAMRNGKQFISGNSTVVNIQKASHTVEKLWWDGNNLCGKLEILNTPSGNIARTILEAGKTLGISSRGLGSVKQLTEDNTVQVQEDFELICFDLVSAPSTTGAYLRTLNESKDYGVQEQHIKKYFFINKIINDILIGA